MQYHRLYADEAGESHWETVQVTLDEKEFAPPAQAIEVSASEAATAHMFLRLRAGWNEPVHTSPVRQKLICLRGAVRVTASDGETRDIKAGDVWFMEDLTGKGHHTAVLGEADFEAVIVQHD